MVVQWAHNLKHDDPLFSCRSFSILYITLHCVHYFPLCTFLSISSIVYILSCLFHLVLSCLPIEWHLLSGIVLSFMV
jgi:hypothetical protein